MKLDWETKMILKWLSKPIFGCVLLRWINVKILLSYEIENGLALKTMDCIALTMFSCKNITLVGKSRSSNFKVLKSKIIPVEVIYSVVPEQRCFLSHHKTIGWTNLLRHLSTKQSCCSLLTQRALKQNASNIAKICKTLQKIISAFLWYVLENFYLSYERG